MKSLARSAVGILLTLLILSTGLGSKGATVSVRAQELNNELLVTTEETTQESEKEAVAVTEEATGAKTPVEELVEEEMPKAETPEPEIQEPAKVETPEPVKAETPTKTTAEPQEEMLVGAPRQRALDVCFYIRGAGIGADIPKEPGLHFSTEYSSAIRVDDAVLAEKYASSGREVDGSEESLLSDGFTASNSVSQMLQKLPQAEDIKSVVGEFDVTKHYVVWYVSKYATTPYPNADVTIHIDGVIRERTTTGGDIGGGEEDPEEPVIEDPVIEDPIPDVTIEIRALFRENGKEVDEVVYDGKEHYIGGFEIIINNKETGNPILRHLYDCFGGYIETVYADDGTGTVFEYEHQKFWVNVVKAYAKITNPGDSREVIFYDANDNPLRTAADFIIKDSAGNMLPAKFNVVPTTGAVQVAPRNITIEAGTKVMNNSGQTLTDNSFEITSGSLAPGHKISKITINGSQTGVGKCSNEITYIEIVDENGNPVTGYYNIKKVKGSLILVDPVTGEVQARTTGETDTASSSADGKELSKTTVKQTVSGMTIVSGNVRMETLGEANVSDSIPQVLGARRGATEDASDNRFLRIMLLFACFACGLFVVKNGKHTN